MIGAWRILLLGFVVLSAVYVYLSIRGRWREKQALETKFEASIDPDKSDAAREKFVAEGLEAYGHSLRRKLILGVYVVPFLIVITMVYVTNFM
jgi:Ca2+/Na+ antiporter